MTRADRLRARARTRTPAARVVAVACVVTLAVVALTLAFLFPQAAPSPRPPREAIVLSQRITPRSALFGDRISAEIAAYTDDRRIDPSSVAVAASFAPYRALATTTERSSRDGVSLLRRRVLLQCLTGACLPPREESRTFTFTPATVTYLERGEQRRLDAAWESVRVGSRLTAQHTGLADTPPSLDAPPRVSPTLARAVLVALAVMLALAGCWLIVAALRPQTTRAQRRWRRLTPLERALAHLDEAARTDDEGLRRRALDQLSVRLADADLDTLQERSRTLAWREEAPQPEALDELGLAVRGSLNGGALR